MNADPTNGAPEDAIATRNEHLLRANRLAMAFSILELIETKLSRYRVANSNPLDTGVIVIPNQELMSAVGNWTVAGTRREISRGKGAVAEVYKTELEKAASVTTPAQDQLGNNSAAQTDIA